jgi:hypothetical protein
VSDERRNAGSIQQIKSAECSVGFSRRYKLIKKLKI